MWIESVGRSAGKVVKNCRRADGRDADEEAADEKDCREKWICFHGSSIGETRALTGMIH
jgi:3-deoxy-D-manno-octulosonic-acid transferase